MNKKINLNTLFSNFSYITNIMFKSLLGMNNNRMNSESKDSKMGSVIFTSPLMVCILVIIIIKIGGNR